MDWCIVKPGTEGDEVGDGAWRATAPGLGLTVMPDAEDARVCVKHKYQPLKKPPVHKKALLATLAGVRLYIRNGQMVLTTEDLEL